MVLLKSAWSPHLYLAYGLSRVCHRVGPIAPAHGLRLSSVIIQIPIIPCSSHIFGYFNFFFFLVRFVCFWPSLFHLIFFMVIQTFLGFMKGKAPQTILTDKNMWLKEAIAIEMPATKHAFCIWHIIVKFSDWFSVLLGSRYDDWKAEFHRLYNLELVEDFEQEWREMINKYGLHENKHIASLYALRTYWALPFLRCYFFAGMMTTFQPESINALIQRFLSAQSQLDHFIERVRNLFFVFSDFFFFFFF